MPFSRLVAPSGPCHVIGLNWTSKASPKVQGPKDPHPNPSSKPIVCNLDSSNLRNISAFWLVLWMKKAEQLHSWTLYCLWGGILRRPATSQAVHEVLQLGQATLKRDGGRAPPWSYDGRTEAEGRPARRRFERGLPRSRGTGGGWAHFKPVIPNRNMDVSSECHQK